MRPLIENRIPFAVIIIFLITPLATTFSRNIAFLILIIGTILLLMRILLKKNSIKPEYVYFVSTESNRFNYIMMALCVFMACYAAFSLLWSTNPGRGLGALTQVTAATLATVLCISMFGQLRPALTWLCWALPAAVFVACIAILTELMTASMMREFVGADTETFRLNRAAVSATLFYPLIFLLPPTRISLFFKILIYIFLCTTVFLSISESSKLVVIVTLFVFTSSLFINSKNLLIICGACLIASHVFAPIIALFVFFVFTPERLVELGYGSQHWRPIIWVAYAKEIANAPIIGHGIQASFSAGASYSGNDAVMQSGLAFIHPHNFSLQIWYELGVVGVAISTAIFVLLLYQALSLPDRQRIVGSVTLSGIWAVAYVSHGAWQSWWWGLVGIVAVLFFLLGSLDDEYKTALVNKP